MDNMTKELAIRLLRNLAVERRYYNLTGATNACEACNVVSLTDYGEELCAYKVVKHIVPTRNTDYVHNEWTIELI